MSSLFFTVTIETVSLQKEEKKCQSAQVLVLGSCSICEQEKIPFHHYKPTLKEKIRDIFRKKVKILTNSLIFTNMQISIFGHICKNKSLSFPLRPNSKL